MPLKVGPMVRRLLPGSIEAWVANVYRSVFVDLGKVASRLADCIPKSAHVLDIGGGDGELLNRLFKLRPDIRVTMVDVNASVGRYLSVGHRAKVLTAPGTTIQSHVATLRTKYDVAIVVDVMHHIPMSERVDFLHSVSSALLPNGILLIKDVEPGYFRATLGYFCDRYVSGDRGVELISATGLQALLKQIKPKCVVTESDLFEEDRPNYLIKVRGL